MKNARLFLIAGFGIALTAAAAAVTPPSTPVDEQVKRGVAAWEAGNHKDAVDIWRPLATAGDSDAQFNLAQAYRLGQGVTADQVTARNWYQKAASGGHTQAQANYGLILFERGERQAAMPWLAKAADNGDARAQYVYGTALFNGDHVPKNWVKAYALMSRAADSGLTPAVTSRDEMDKYIPLGDRQKGLAAAMSLPRLDGKAAVAPKAPPKAALPPAPRIAAAPVVAATISGPWRIQLGAYSDEGRARSLWSGLQGKVAELGGLQPYLVKAGAVTRLQGGPLSSKSAADRTCAQVKAAGQDCFAIRP